MADRLAVLTGVKVMYSKHVTHRNVHTESILSRESVVVLKFRKNIKRPDDADVRAQILNALGRLLAKHS